MYALCTPLPACSYRSVTRRSQIEGSLVLAGVEPSVAAAARSVYTSMRLAVPHRSAPHRQAERSLSTRRRDAAPSVCVGGRTWVSCHRLRPRSHTSLIRADRASEFGAQTRRGNTVRTPLGPATPPAINPDPTTVKLTPAAQIAADSTTTARGTDPEEERMLQMALCATTSVTPRSNTFRAPCSLFLTSYPNFSLSSQLECSFYPSCLCLCSRPASCLCLSPLPKSLPPSNNSG